jgi:hypothetical protein
MKNCKKNSKMEIGLCANGIGGWKMISTWIIPTPLGTNGIHIFNFLHLMRKLLLNLIPSEPLALIKKLPYFDDPMEFDILLEGVLFLGVHDSIKYHMFYVGRILFYRG